jgi:hypothetical protein
MTVRTVIPTRFQRESVKLGIPIAMKPVRDIGHQLVAVHSTLCDARRSANWQAVHLAMQDLEMLLLDMGEPCSH